MLRSFAFGLLGLVATPVIMFFAVLMLAHALDPRCGTSGDSGGCEMGSASIAIASALPAFLIFFLVPFVRGLRQHKMAGDRQPDSTG